MMNITGISPTLTHVALQAVLKAQQQAEDAMQAIASGQKVDNNGGSESVPNTVGTNVDETA